ncbi:MAG: hypothetical protein S4CHLAM7_12490 [Chlamydiae bacterium]|nr:hypothetical protein [Chlamydiota bacterium]
MTTEQAFNLFLKDFIDKYKNKLTCYHKASWLLETAGSKKTASELAKYDHELNLLFTDKENYQKLVSWKKEGSITSPDLLRILKLLIKKYEENQVPKELLEQISQKEAKLSHTYVQFRAYFEEKETGENQLLNILKTELNVERRKEAWKASKEIGKTLAPQILEIVKLRNQKAHRLGYSDFYQMQLEHQEIDKKWLFKFLAEFTEKSQPSHTKVIQEIEQKLSERFNVKSCNLGPWSWSDPFCQSDPLFESSLDDLFKDVDLLQVGTDFFSSMGFEITDILNRSDLYERSNKNQHAFCTHIDREGDVRILTNLQPTFRWLDTLLHELGHGVYEKGFDPSLSWILKQPPHMIPTEAIALIMGRSAYDPHFLKTFIKSENLETSLQEALKSLQRTQLLFSRWVLVMIHFEANLYQNPQQDLNHLWWTLVQKYQKICPPSHYADKFDWACKYHIGLAPVYYHSYLLGEFFASMLKKEFTHSESPSLYGQRKVSDFLNTKLFFPGNRLKWDLLIEQVLAKPLHYQDWIEDFKL